MPSTGTDQANAGAARIAAHFQERDRWRVAECLPWLIIAGLFPLMPGQIPILTQILVLILFAISLDLVLGHAGIVTLGHAAFFGIGAYTVGILSVHAGWNEPVSALLASGLVAGAAGLVSGALLLRYQGLPLLMLTMATAALLAELVNFLAPVTGGYDGLSGIEPAPLFGLFAFTFTGQVQYVYAAIVLFLCFVLARRLIRSPFGQSLRGIRDNRLRMAAVGTRVLPRLLGAYVISTFLAGIAGGLFAQTNAYVTLEVLSFERSGGVMVMLAIAGLARTYGAFIGATLYTVLEHHLANLSPEFWELGLGLALIGVVLFARGGLLPAAERLTRARKGRS